MNDWKRRDRITFREKGSGWTISLRDCGSYIECFFRSGERCIELNFFDGDSTRDASWTLSALDALEIAYHWQSSNDTMEEAVEQSVAGARDVYE